MTNEISIILKLTYLAPNHGRMLMVLLNTYLSKIDWSKC